MNNKTQGGHGASENEHQMDRKHVKHESQVHRQPHEQSTPRGQDKYEASTPSVKEECANDHKVDWRDLKHQHTVHKNNMDNQPQVERTTITNQYEARMQQYETNPHQVDRNNMNNQ